MHIHSNIDVRDEMPSGETLQLVTFHERVYRSKDQVAALELIHCGLPFIADLNDGGIRLHTADQSRRNLSFPHLVFDVFQCSANETCRIREIDSVVIRKDISANADVCELLNDM